MKIQIKAQGKSFSLALPTGLLFSKPMVWMGLKFMKASSAYAAKYIPEQAEAKAGDFLNHIPEESAYALCAELKHIKKKHRSWTLVEVYSPSGEQVKITL